MKAILASSLGGSVKVNGKRIPSTLMEENGLLDRIKSIWTENAFMKKLGLKEKLKNYSGIVIAWSAGSMNCAEIVYAGPELEGEAIDSNYQRWISGLGLTKVNIFPHFQSLTEEVLDGLRVIEDITYADSMGHEFLALNDGSYLMIEDGTETVYGKAYRIKDGCQEQICKDGESVVLKTK